MSSTLCPKEVIKSRDPATSTLHSTPSRCPRHRHPLQYSHDRVFLLPVSTTEDPEEAGFQVQLSQRHLAILQSFHSSLCWPFPFLSARHHLRAAPRPDPPVPIPSISIPITHRPGLPRLLRLPECPRRYSPLRSAHPSGSFPRDIMVPGLVYVSVAPSQLLSLVRARYLLCPGPAALPPDQS